MDMLILEGNNFKILPSYGKVMNILFVREDRMLIDELKEYIFNLKAIAFFADNLNEIEKILRENSVDLVIIPLRTLSNLEVLTFINENFKDTKIVITVDGDDNILKSKNRKKMYMNYDLLKKQLRLFELKKAIVSRINYDTN